MNDYPKQFRPIFDELLQFDSAFQDWNTVERKLADIAGDKNLYLGGDSLRPYAQFNDASGVVIAAIQRSDLPLPPYLRTLIPGNDSHYDFKVDERTRAHVIRATEGNLKSRSVANIPRLLLIGLGDPQRYQGMRLPLGISRLAQWLRFKQAARVEVFDYSLDSESELSVNHRLSSGVFSIVGISVNFGQWNHLETIAARIESLREKPIVVLGNILAAFSPAESMALFPSCSAFVATDLGERALEALCTSLRNEGEIRSVPGLVGRDNPNAAAARPQTVPPDVIFPDDGLVRAVVAAGGQVSLETSFGCQFDACTFCPRKHRGVSWQRADVSTITAAIDRLSRVSRNLNATPLNISYIDEEFFGEEGLEDGNVPQTATRYGKILKFSESAGARFEIYTRVEQIFSRRRSLQWNLERARILLDSKNALSRVFLGVESGSPRQLRRYGKGQQVSDIADALRVGSLLGLPMEFGFITFDPRLEASELLENVLFLARQDLFSKPTVDNPSECLRLVEIYYNGETLPYAVKPLFTSVAYMATELEVLANSQYAATLSRQYKTLLDGTYDSNFARFGTRYRDNRIGDIAGWCRVWTEGMFTPVYAARMDVRTRQSYSSESEKSAQLVGRYKTATFFLLAELTSRQFPQYAEDARIKIQECCGPMPSYLNHLDSVYELFKELSVWVSGDDDIARSVKFDMSLVSSRRSS